MTTKHQARTKFSIFVAAPESCKVEAKITVDCKDDALRRYAVQELETAVRIRARQLNEDAGLPASERRNTTQGFPGG